jgi:thioredoxin 1
MSRGKRLTILVVVLALVVAAFLMRQAKRSTPGPGGADSAIVDGAGASQSSALPRLLDLGSDQCVPCKMMVPILKELKEEYASVFRTEVIDVRKNRAKGVEFDLKIIPTQIFFDASGQEVFRNQGFMSKEDILQKWQELGVDIQPNDS